MRSFRLILVLGLSAMVAACGDPQISDVGGNGNGQGDDDDDGSTPTPVPGSFSLAITSAPLSMDLNVASSIDFTITPAGGFTGTVDVTLPANVAGITGIAKSVAVTGTTPVTGSIDVDTTTYKDVVPGKYTDLVLHAASGAIVSDAMVEAMINPTLLLHIKAGVGSAAASAGTPDVWGADSGIGPDGVADTGDEGIFIHFGRDALGAPNTTFNIGWINDDTVNHTIHAGGNSNDHGIQHGDTNVNNSDVDGNPGATQTRTLNRGVNDPLDPLDPTDMVTLAPNTFYCHNHLGTNLATGHAAKITLLN